MQRVEIAIVGKMHSVERDCATKLQGPAMKFDLRNLVPSPCNQAA